MNEVIQAAAQLQAVSEWNMNAELAKVETEALLKQSPRETNLPGSFNNSEDILLLADLQISDRRSQI